MMPYMSFPMPLRHAEMIIVFICLIASFLCLAFYIKRKNLLLSALSFIVFLFSYFCLQIMAGIAKRNCQPFYFTGVPVFVTDLPSVIVNSAFIVTLVLTAVIAIFAVHTYAIEPHPGRFSKLKSDIHDTFGLSLVSIKAYLSGQDIDKDTVMMLYSKCNKYLGLEKLYSGGTYESVTEVGGLIGVSLVLNGELPDDERYRPFICTALSECMINTLRHAWGDTVYADVSVGENTEIVIRNNGRRPTEEICEKGGLKHLRDYAGTLGIGVHIESIPEFRLTLIVPKEDKNGL